MTNCMNMSVTTGSRECGATQVTRHDRWNPGGVFTLGLSRVYRGQGPEGITERPEVGR